MTTNWLQNVFDEIGGGIVKVKAYMGDGSVSIGTGFLVHVDGYIITALHVVESATRIEVIPENWRKPIPATVKFRHKDDLAMLAVDYKSLDANFKARFSPVKVCARNKHAVTGTEVGIAGYAWAMESADYSTLFVFRRTVALNIMHPEHSKGIFYYIDGTAIAGMSGGPVFTSDAEVVGVIVRIQPEKYFEFKSAEGKTVLPSPEHLTIALQSFYVHMGMEQAGIYL